MSRHQEPDRYNEHGQDERVSLEERAYLRELEERHEPVLSRRVADVLGDLLAAPENANTGRHPGPPAEHREVA